MTDIHWRSVVSYPKEDIPRLEEIGAKGVFPVAPGFDTIVESIRSWF